MNSDMPKPQRSENSETSVEPIAVHFPTSLREFRQGIIHYKIAERVEQRRLRRLTRGIILDRTREFCPEREVFPGRS